MYFTNSLTATAIPFLIQRSRSIGFLQRRLMLLFGPDGTRYLPKNSVG